MNHTVMDMDPLSSYEYPMYNNYPVNTSHQYSYNIKLEEYYGQNPNNTAYTNNEPQQALDQPLSLIEQPKQEIDKNEAKSATKSNRKDKKSFCSKKINDATFPFYGCSVCNISYLALNELDQHVTIHKNRMTSYRLRLRNQFKKKQIKKEKRKLKKMKKIKKEIGEDIEIKPEDGYIGNKKAVDYNDINNDSGTLDNVGITGNDGILQNAGCTENGHNPIDKVINGNTEDVEINNMEKIYKCFACQKQFTLSYYLKLHVRSHTDEKPYTCSVCGQSFITASKLGRHNKRIHLAARFQCRICFKIFSRFELLTSHFDKNHPEDKLDGEPYDYYAILPYLKELEEQLKEQSEVKEQKSEGSWIEPGVRSDIIKEEVQSQDESQEMPTKVEVIVDEENRNNFEVKVKLEVEKNEYVGLNAGDDMPADEVPIDETLADDFRQGDDDHDDDDDEIKIGDLNKDGLKKDESHKDCLNKYDDSFSDEDYFPANTWASTPKCDPSPPPPPCPKLKKTYKMIKCEICQKEISSLSYMRVHMRTHTGEKPFKCGTCGRGFITSSKLNRHILTHGGDLKTDIKSENCDLNPEDDEKPETTKSSKKKKKKSKKKKDENGEVKKHQKRPYACEYCNQRFLHLNMMEVHKKCHEGEELVLKCHFCLEEAHDMTSLKEHEATHIGPKPYLCTICGRSYKKRETMVYHRKHHQSEHEYIICDVCSKRFNEQGKLAKHLRTHTAEKFVLRYECPVCAHMFNTKYHVQMHLATHQKEGLILESNRNEVLAMVLQNALKIPKQPDATANLTDITPADERYCICKICGETFHHFYYLEEHLKSHGSKIAIDNTTQIEEKKYICEVCNKGFKLHYYLKLHSFTHSKEKPFICQQCGKGFITKGKLKRHLETHTGLKKYQCHICYKFFTRPSYLRIHIRTIHGTQDYNFRFDKSCMALSAMSALTQISDSQNSV